MKFTLQNNVPITIADLIENAWYRITKPQVNSVCIVRIAHTITAWTQVYYEWAGTELSPGVFVDSSESNFLSAWESINLSIEYLRLNSIRLLACCANTDIYITLL